MHDNCMSYILVKSSPIPFIRKSLPLCDMLPMRGFRDRSCREKNGQIALPTHFKPGFFPNGCIITQRRVLRNGIVPNLQVFVHSVAHLHGDGICQKRMVNTSSIPAFSILSLGSKH